MVAEWCLSSSALDTLKQRCKAGAANMREVGEIKVDGRMPDVFALQDRLAREIAEGLRLSPDTVMRESRLAKAWLARELSGGRRRDA
jgi:hypothetical protein